MKGLEEIQGIFQTWPEGFKNTFGRAIKKSELISHLKEIKAKKEIKSVLDNFSTHSACDIQVMIEYLETNDVPNIDSEPKRKGER